MQHIITLVMITCRSHSSFFLNFLVDQAANHAGNQDIHKARTSSLLGCSLVMFRFSFAQVNDCTPHVGRKELHFNRFTESTDMIFET